MVALLTLNCFVAPAFVELELIPELAVAELLPGAEADDPAGLELAAPAFEFILPEAAAPSCPVT